MAQILPAHRDAMVRLWRRRVFDHTGFTPFVHQAEPMLASEGLTLTDLEVGERDPLPDGGDHLHVHVVCAPDDSRGVRINDLTVRTERRLVVPRRGGVAHQFTDLAAYKAGKALTLDTWLPTPYGYVRMGDVEVGTELLDERGHVTRVVGAGPVHIDPTGTYRVRFDDGTYVDAAGRHEWAVTTLVDRQKRRSSRIVETRKLRRTKNKHGQREFGIAVAGAWDLPRQELPLDPYMLGVWLGDGSTACGYVTSADHHVVTELRRLGFVVTKAKARYSWSVQGLTTKLRAINVLGQKHVPGVYLRASRDQRLALLQGLMDTDGSAEGRGKGRCEFMNTNWLLARAVYELACSLGLKPRIRRKRATLYGKDCGSAWRVVWTSALPVFRIPRKLARLPKQTGGKVGYRFVDHVDRLPDQPVRCIEVDSPSHLFLAGKAGIPTHNSKGVGLWTAGFAPIPGARIDMIGIEYKTSENEFNYLLDALLAGPKPLVPKYEHLYNDPRNGRMFLELRNKFTVEVRSWERREGLKGAQRTAYLYNECYQLPGLEVFTSVAQNLRAEQGFAGFTTTCDRPWVSFLHEMGHGTNWDGVRDDWHCSCGTPGWCNAYTFDRRAFIRDCPDAKELVPYVADYPWLQSIIDDVHRDRDRGVPGLMTKERFAIAWLGLLGTFAGRVFNYQRGQAQFTPATHPAIWKRGITEAWVAARVDADVTEAVDALQI